jgi:DNA-binding XRE family transcriptional regulator
VSEQTSPELSRVALTGSGRVVEVRFFGLDSVLCLRFADGYERAVRWTDLPFATRLAFAPVAGSVGDAGDSVVLTDAAGGMIDLSAESVRAALDDDYREALESADDRERRLVGAKIRAVRKRANLSQLELSRRSGIAQESLSRIEKGLRDPRLGTLRRLAQGMGLSLDQLLEGLRAEG